jgi:hypothetical protein
MKNTNVKFKVTKLLDPVKTGGKLAVGETFTGQYDGSRIWFTDWNDVEWVFYPGTTCELLK